MNYLIKDHAICITGQKIQHVIVKKIENGDVYYVQNFGSGRLFPAKLRDLHPFNFAQAKSLKNKKTQQFIDQIIEGKTLKTASMTYIYDGSELIQHTCKRTISQPNEISLNFDQSKFIFNTQLPSIKISNDDQQISYESLNTYPYICNNHSCIVLPTTSVVEIQAMKQSLELQINQPFCSQGILVQIAKNLQAANIKFAELSLLETDFQQEFYKVFIQNEQNCARKVFNQMREFDSTVKGAILFCEQWDFSQLGLDDRCMVVCIIDFLSQRDYKYFK